MANNTGELKMRPLRTPSSPDEPQKKDASSFRVTNPFFAKSKRSGAERRPGPVPRSKSDKGTVVCPGAASQNAPPAHKPPGSISNSLLPRHLRPRPGTRRDRATAASALAAKPAATSSALAQPLSDDTAGWRARTVGRVSTCSSDLNMVQLPPVSAQQVSMIRSIQQAWLQRKITSGNRPQPSGKIPKPIDERRMTVPVHDAC